MFWHLYIIQYLAYSWIHNFSLCSCDQILPDTVFNSLSVTTEYNEKASTCSGGYSLWRLLNLLEVRGYCSLYILSTLYTSPDMEENRSLEAIRAFHQNGALKMATGPVSTEESSNTWQVVQLWVMVQIFFFWLSLTVVHEHLFSPWIAQDHCGIPCRHNIWWSLCFLVNSGISWALQ